MSNSVVLTIAVLTHLLSKKELVSGFPFMRYAHRTWNAKKSGSGCGNCGHAKPTRDVKKHILETVKAHLTSLPQNEKDRFKQMSGVGEFIINLSGGKDAKIIHV